MVKKFLEKIQDAMPPVADVADVTHVAHVAHGCARHLVIALEFVSSSLQWLLGERTMVAECVLYHPQRRIGAWRGSSLIQCSSCEIAVRDFTGDDRDSHRRTVAMQMTVVMFRWS